MSYTRLPIGDLGGICPSPEGERILPAQLPSGLNAPLLEGGGEPPTSTPRLREEFWDLRVREASASCMSAFWGQGPWSHLQG